MTTIASLLWLLAQASAPPSATEQLLSQGLSGVVILGLCAALLYQVRKNDKQQETIAALNESRLADRDLRLADQRENAKVLLEVSDRYKETTLAATAEQRELKEEIQALRPRTYR